MIVHVSIFFSSDVCCRTTGISSRGSCVCLFMWTCLYTQRANNVNLGYFLWGTLWLKCGNALTQHKNTHKCLF